MVVTWVKKRTVQLIELRCFLDLILWIDVLNRDKPRPQGFRKDILQWRV